MKTTLTLDSRLLAIIGRRWPAIYDVIPRGPLSRFLEVALNPQPLPPDPPPNELGAALAAEFIRTAWLADRFGLRVTVCHYPTRCSRWNPVEFRLFSHISMNWVGRPLRSLDIMLAYIRGTSTTTGLTVKASLLDGNYYTSRKITKAEMDELSLHVHAVCPNWNYTIDPRLIPGGP